MPIVLTLAGLLILAGVWFYAGHNANLKIRLYPPYLVACAAVLILFVLVGGFPIPMLIVAVLGSIAMVIGNLRQWMFCKSCGGMYHRRWLLEPNPDRCSSCGGDLHGWGRAAA